MGIVLTDSVFELISQHLNFDDILNLMQTSKSLHEIVTNSKICMRKVKLNLTCDNNEEIVSFLNCFRHNKRKYQNLVVDCHGNHYITEKYMLILKTLERSIVDLEVANASFRWDEINTRNFTDQWLILTDLKRLKVININDYTAEIFFISCTYLELLHVEGVRLSKYFNYCLRMNEKLKDLKILKPKGINYDYEFYGFTSYKFKLKNFDFLCNEEMDRQKHEFLLKVIYPVIQSQLRSLESCEVEGVYVDVINTVISELSSGEKNSKRLKIALNEDRVELKVNELTIRASGSLSVISEFHKNLSNFLNKNSACLKEITISLNNNYDEDLASILFSNLHGVSVINIGGHFDNIYGGVNEKIVKILTSSTCFHEITTFLKIAPNLQVLQVFEMTKELADFIEVEMKELKVIYFHYIQPNCDFSNKKLVKITSLDPLLRICLDLHELIYQHMDYRNVDELAQTWTQFCFDG